MRPTSYFLFHGVLAAFMISCVNTNRLPNAVASEGTQSETIEHSDIDHVEYTYNPILEEEQAELHVEEVMDEWASLRLEPIQLNTATFDNLLRLPGFRPSYARAFLRHRKNVGRFFSYNELKAIKGIPQDIWDHAIEFTTLGTPLERLGQSIFNLKYWTPKSTVESITRVKIPTEPSLGYRSDQRGKQRVYPGPPTDRYQRISFSSSRVKTGITMRSGAGAYGTWLQPSWQAMSLQFKHLPLISSLVLGDYRLHWGLGIGMNSSGSYRKGSDLVHLATKRNTISPHLGSSYVGHHSGLALSLGTKTNLTLWVSNRSYTASEIDSSTVRWSSSEPYFRTSSETQKRDNLALESFGFRLNGSLRSISWGVYAWQMESDRYIALISEKFPEISYRKRTFSMVGADLQWNYRNGSLATEWAIDHDVSLAGIIAKEYSLSEEVSFSSVYRNYSAGFSSPFGASFSAWSGSPGNEHGVYNGLELRPGSAIQAVLFMDHYTSHLPKGNDYYVKRGSDMGLKMSLNVHSYKIEVTGKHSIKSDEIEKFDAIGRIIMSQQDTDKYTMRLVIKQDAIEQLKWSTRVEWVRVSTTGGKAEHGRQLAQDLVWIPHHVLRVQARVAIFSTQGYSTRIYAYEPDVALISSIPAFQGEGVRNFVLVNYRPHPTIETGVKWAKTLMQHVFHLGTGNDLIEGNQKSTIHLSLRLRI